MFDKDDIIYSYTTKEAVKDGELVRLDHNQYSAAKIKFPVYFTRIVWDRYIEHIEHMEESEVQKRIHAMMVLFANKAKNTNEAPLTFSYYYVADKGNKLPQANESTREGMPDTHKEAKLKAVITAQDIDDPSPAIFIMLPWED